MPDRAKSWMQKCKPSVDVPPTLPIRAIFSSRSSIIPNGWTSNCDAPTDSSHEHSTDIYAGDSLCPTLRKANIKPPKRITSMRWRSPSTMMFEPQAKVNQYQSVTSAERGSKQWVGSGTPELVWRTVPAITKRKWLALYSTTTTTYCLSSRKENGNKSKDCR